VLATAACAATLWTDRFTRTLRRVPVPPTKKYLQGLRRRLLHHAVRGEEVVNVGSRGVAAKSLIRAKGPMLRKKVTAIVNTVKDVAERAGRCRRLIEHGADWGELREVMTGRGLPVNGYATKFVPALIVALRCAPRSWAELRGTASGHPRCITGFVYYRLRYAAVLPGPGCDIAFYLYRGTTCRSTP